MNDRAFPFPRTSVPPCADQVSAARSEIAAFIEALKRPRRSMGYFAALVQTPDLNRLSWLCDIRLSGESFIGREAIQHTPDRQEQEVHRDEVLDWLFVHNYRLIGGFTFRDRVMEVVEYFDDLSSDVSIGLDKPSKDDWDYWDEIDDFCLPLDEDNRVGPAFELFDAIGNGEHELVAEILEKHDCVNTWCEVATGRIGTVQREMLTPLLYAIWSGDEQSAALCLDAGARVQAQLGGRLREKMTALHYAAIEGMPDIVRRLLSLGSPIEGRAGDGRTPLTCATWAGQHECMRVLIDHGANVNDRHENFREEDGVRTGIVAPVLDGGLDLETAKILHEAGANFEVTDGEGLTPLNIAAMNGYLELAEFLLEIGCDPNTRDNEGMTPPMRALECPDDREAAVRFAKLCERCDK